MYNLNFRTMMRSLTLFIFIVFLVYLSQIVLLTAAQPFLDSPTCNNTNGNYTSSSTYGKNLKTLLSIISSNTQVNNKFFNLSVGHDPDIAYGIAICRFDRSSAECHSYLSNAVQGLTEVCPVQKEAIGFYFGALMIRYSNRPIFRLRENSPNYSAPDVPQNIPEAEIVKLKQSLGNLLEGLKLNASSGNSSFKFSSGEKEITNSLKLYGLAQCNPYLSSSECSYCLEDVNSKLQQCCSTLTGGAMFGPICTVQFGNYPMLANYSDNSQNPILPATPDRFGNTGIQSGNKKHIAYGIWIVIIVGVLSFGLFATLTFSISRRKMRKKLKQEVGNGQIKLVDSLQLDFSTIQLATDDFSDAKRLGNGSSAAMYKGLLPDGQEIVVKRLHKVGRDSELEFDNEVLLSTNLQHKNLVKLLGFCIEKDLRFLVYEFLSNGSLLGFLNDPVKRANLDWQTRYQIISGLARGLLYLHEGSQVRVIHRDLKPSNILLGTTMDSKISNFRTASLVQSDQTRGDTRVVGTYGYMPLEYVQHGQSSIKSDIFSFGVILLEIITGFMISGFSDGSKEETLLIHVWRKWCDGTAMDVVDQALPNIQKERHLNQIERCIKMALLCVQEDPRHRPSMSTVVIMLNSDIVDVAEPTRPAPLILNNIDLQSDSHTSRTDKSQETSLNEASISYLEPR